MAAAQGSSSGASSGSAEQEDTAGQQLVDYISGLYRERKLSAKDICTISHFAAAAGLAEAKPTAMDPAKPAASASGHYQRHLDRRLDYLQDGEQLYRLRIPGHHPSEMARSTYDLLVVPPHESVQESIAADSTILSELQKLNDNRKLPDCYYNHPIVKTSKVPVLPISVFCDGVPYTNADSVIGFWIVNEVNGHRDLFCILRKGLICECGCRGWCSLWQVWAFLAWSLDALAVARYPSLRHNGDEFDMGRDRRRRDLSGAEMGISAAVIYIKADWSELASTFGFASWQDNRRPCFCCATPAADLYKGVGEASALRSPFRLNEIGDYALACDRCEILVVVDASARDRLLSSLALDKRDRGARGMALVRDEPEMGLRQGDRLEPSAFLSDHALLDQISKFPHPLLFWRRSNDSIARHRNPLLKESLGLAPETCLTVDTLHAINLGVMLVFCRELVWELVRQGFWGVRSTQEEQLEVSALAIRADLKSFYKARHRANKTEGLTRIRGFGQKKLGTFAAPALKSKKCVET